MNRRITFYFVCIILAILFSCSNSGKNSPSFIVQKSREALKALEKDPTVENRDNFVQYFHVEDEKNKKLFYANFDDPETFVFMLNAKSKPSTNQEILEEKINGDKATVIVENYYSDGITKKFAFNLVKVENEWKILVE